MITLIAKPFCFFGLPLEVWMALREAVYEREISLCRLSDARVRLSEAQPATAKQIFGEP